MSYTVTGHMASVRRSHQKWNSVVMLRQLGPLERQLQSRSRPRHAAIIKEEAERALGGGGGDARRSVGAGSFEVPAAPARAFALT